MPLAVINLSWHYGRFRWEFVQQIMQSELGKLNHRGLKLELMFEYLMSDGLIRPISMSSMLNLIGHRKFMAKV